MGCEREIGNGGGVDIPEEVSPQAFMEKLVELHAKISKLESLSPSEPVNLLFTQLVRLCIRPCPWSLPQVRTPPLLPHSHHCREVLAPQNCPNNGEGFGNGIGANHHHEEEEEVVSLISGWVNNRIAANHHHHEQEEVVNHLISGGFENGNSAANHPHYEEEELVNPIVGGEIKNGISLSHHHQHEEEEVINHISGEAMNGIRTNNHQEEEVFNNTSTGGLRSGISANHNEEEEEVNPIYGGVKNGISRANHHEEEEEVNPINGGVKNGISSNHYEEGVGHLLNGGVKNGISANYHEEEVGHPLNGGLKNGISANHKEEEEEVNPINGAVIKNGISANHQHEEEVDNSINGGGVNNGISANQDEEELVNYMDEGIKNGISTVKQNIMRKAMEVRSDLIKLCGKAEGLLESHYSRLIGNLPEPHTQLHLFPYYNNYRKLAFLEYTLLVEHGGIGIGIGGEPIRLAFVGSGPLPLTSLVLALHHLPPNSRVDNYDMDGEANELARRLLSGHPDLASRMGFHSCNIKKVEGLLGGYGVVFLAALVGMDGAAKAEVIEHLGQHMAPGATLVARSAHGSRAFLYPVIEASMLSPWFEVLSVFHPQDDILNSVIIARKKHHPL